MKNVLQEGLPKGETALSDPIGQRLPRVWTNQRAS